MTLLRFFCLIAFYNPIVANCDDLIANPGLNDALVAYAGGLDESASRLLRPLADRDIAIAQLLLARLYVHSPLVKRDCSGGINLLVRSSSNGNAEAAFELGHLYRRGHCVPTSGSKAVAAFRIAEELGHSQAPTALGGLYLGWDDVDANHSAAVEWFKKGALMFDSEACYQLGRLFSGASQIPPDFQEAYKWFEIAASFAFSASYDYERAIADRDRLREKMSPLQSIAASAQAKQELQTIISRNRMRRVARGS